MAADTICSLLSLAHACPVFVRKSASDHARNPLLIEFRKERGTKDLCTQLRRWRLADFAGKVLFFFFAYIINFKVGDC